MTDYRTIVIGDLMIRVPTALPTEARAKELEVAWKRVEPATHWKAPVDATIYATEEELVDVLEAIEFYTATPGEATKVETIGHGIYRFHVTAPGYWAGPAN